jgi:hypothetical protein
MITPLLEVIYERLDKNGFKPEIVNDKVLRSLVFKVPAGSTEYECLIYNIDFELRELINSEFEKYNFIEGYKAIWSSANKKIESEIIEADFNHASGLQFDMKSTLNVLNNFLPECKKITKSSKLVKIENIELMVTNPEEIENIEFEAIEDIKVSIGLCSQEFAVLRGCRWLEIPFEFQRIQKNRWTLKLSNINVNTHDEARKLMLKIANSLFFQIDQLTAIPITLVTDRESRIWRKAGLSIKEHLERPNAKLEAPKYEYDNEAMSLYWYAKSAENMPLLQFLAYYQVIEFYFPVYTELKAKKQIKDITTDSSFDPSNDADIKKLLKVIKGLADDKTYQNESEMLKYTLKSCVIGKELKKFIVSDKERKNFFSKKNDKISENKISLNNKVEDILLGEVASRIYDIRCQIVHSKSAYENTLNHYSPEIKEIFYDLEIIDFIAKRVLSANKKPISLL